MTTPVRGCGYDRVGGSRLTGVGAVLLVALILGVASPPQVTDRQVLAVVWAGMLGLFIVGCTVPVVLARRIRIEAVSPRDAVVGDTVLLEGTLTGRVSSCEVRTLDPTGPWERMASPGTGQIRHLADRRGVFGAVRVEVRVTAPLGILAAHRLHTVQLPISVEVAPKPLDVSWRPAGAPADGGGVDGRLSGPAGDLVRSVRPYVRGDQPNLVHWPSSARVGELVVRELEPPRPVGQVVVVDLRDLDENAERAAAYALGASLAVLRSVGALLIASCEASGPVLGAVRTEVDAGRRLARAVSGQPAAAPPGWPVVEIGA